MADHPIIQFSNTTFAYGGAIALEAITLDIYEGEFVGVIGPNGSGKTTLLKGLLGLLLPTKGTLQIFDCACHDLRCHHRARIGYLPQMEASDPNFPITVWEVAMMGRYGAIGLIKRPTSTDREIVHESLDAVGMSDWIDRPFSQLSGGQQQRVLIARALAQRPQVLLMDEPTTGIDAEAQHRLIDLVCRLHKEFRLTILFVTHDINLISPIVDTIVLLKRRLFGKGPPNEILTKETLSPVYGDEVIIAERDRKAYTIIHDTHHH
ncbi:MAG: metal ABC transporter ATP-binding protein [Nitrospiria bacterium]